MLFFYTLSFWVLISTLGNPNTILKNSYISKLLFVFFTILLISYIPYRDFRTYGEDMLGYVSAFRYFNQLTLAQTFDVAIWEPLFILLQWLISRFTMNPSIYIIVTVVLYISILYKAISNFFFTWQYIYIIFAYFNFTFFYGYIFNGARQGFSMMFLLLSISLWLTGQKNMKFYLACIASCLFHYSVIPALIIIIFIRKFNIKLKSLLLTWSLFAGFFVTGLNRFILNLPYVSNINFVSVYTNEGTLDHFGGKTNNIKFLIFSATFLLIALFLYQKIDLDKHWKNMYLSLIKCYISLNIYFLAFGFIAFSNRVASYSWFLIPILIFFPILHKKKHSPVLLALSIIITFIIGFFARDSFYGF